MDLHRRTLDVLDWDRVVAALAEQARTPMGARAARSLPPRSAADARADHDAVEELRKIEEAEGPIPVGGVGDVADVAKRAAQGQVLEPEALRAAGSTLVSLRQLASRLHESGDDAPTLWGIGQNIQIDGWVADDIDQSFDATGQLSASKYPELGELRKTIGDLHETIRRTLDEMIKGDRFEDLLQDRFVTQRGDRYVLPIKSHAKNWDLGIVHGTSGSGRTVFVEPKEVIALNNRLRIAEGELSAAEHRILGALSATLGRIAPNVIAAIDAATEIDLACAREGLARQLKATRPIVRDEGVVHLVRGRHPVLLLQGVNVVANDLSVDPQHPVLVLTGPNTGGKTVALKTIGLCALLVRAGCFVPADEGSRVDIFDEVLADIGDAQGVQEGLSSFSAHLVALREMVARARPGALFLLDELASGTDPAQGGALARAVLEELLRRGPRVVVTTHYAQLKGLASVDPRFALAAMEYANGRPTYRVVHDATGESHALDTALRMGIPEELVIRARALMGEAERALLDAVQALDAERTRAAEEAARFRASEGDLKRRLAEVERREEALRAKAKDLENREAGRFLERLRAAEKAIGAVVADLQRAPSHDKVEAARASLAALKGLVPPEEQLPSAPPELAVGDRVRLKNLGQAGEVTGLGDLVSVRIGALTVRVKPDELERLGSADGPGAQKSKPTVQIAVSAAAPDLDEAVRVVGNTLDLRGQRVEEAMDASDKFFDDAQMRRYDVVFLLHGHGTGALKEALRSWLRSHPRVRDASPANADQGGDAFTVVALRP
jgi:DNA mismatch repair protein MutS2